MRLRVLDRWTVADVKKALAKLKDTDAGVISIFLAGRELSDDVLLSRQRIPDGTKIMVVIEDIEEICIRTVKALRGTLRG